ncbi:tRNA synthetases class I (M)-domain-containing protein, partial [Tribonema minus]
MRPVLLGPMLLACIRSGNAFSSRALHSSANLLRTSSRRAGASASASQHRCRQWRTAVRMSSGTANGSGEPYYITTPIYYVNDKPHIGHAYTTLACDVIARFMRLDGRDVMFLTGTDEHGQKVQESAAKQGKSPQEFCDEVSQSFRRLIDAMHFTPDRFIRTTEAAHAAAVQALWRALEARGAIYLGTYAGWYSVRDEAFYSESELVDGKAPTGADVAWVEKEPSYFFRLSDYEAPLLELYEREPRFVAPASRRNEVLAFVRGGLRDLSISRTSFSWGVPVPGDPAHVMYVWVDALANYISALGYPETGEGEGEAGGGQGGGQFAKFWPADLHVVGKDILRFHAVYWPALLMAAGLDVPRRLHAHGWWTRDGAKISKSVGNVVDPFELVARYGVDQTRYFLLSEVPFGADGDYSDTQLVLRCNANLANEFGNLAQRALSLVHRNCGAVVPAPGALTAEDEALLGGARGALAACREHVADTQRLDLYCKQALALVQDGNKYIDEQAPWKVRKTGPEGEARAGTILYCLLEVIRRAAILYQPVTPLGAAKMLDALRVPDTPAARGFAALYDPAQAIQPGTVIDKPEPVFPRLELDPGLKAGSSGPPKQGKGGKGGGAKGDSSKAKKQGKQAAEAA